MTGATDQIELVRDFNRYYTRRLGILTDRYLGQDRTVGEARLLFEIGATADVRDLRLRLGLDSGYLSRLLRSLERQRLIQVRTHPSDGRARIAELTPLGERERADLEARSRAGISELLGPLTAEQRDQLVAAQAQVRRLLRLAAVTIEAVDDGDVARYCLRAYASELAVRFPEGYDESTLVRPGELAGHTGALLVAREEGQPVGCVAWRRLGPDVAEVRNLWVGAEARGLGLGRRLLGAVETDAAAHGIAVMRLGTHRALTEAIALYRSCGYREIPTYDESPYNQLAFERPLTS